MFRLESGTSRTNLRLNIKMSLPELSEQDRNWYILKGYEIKESPNGYWREWRLNGNLHREDGPAVEYADGTREWWVNGKLHREDGPAIEWADGDQEWWVNGEPVSREEFKNNS